jgi:hypothetical protein
MVECCEVVVVGAFVLQIEPTNQHLSEGIQKRNSLDVFGQMWRYAIEAVCYQHNCS